MIIASLATLISFAASFPSAHAGWDKDCVDLDLAELKSTCEAAPASDFASNLSLKIAGNAGMQDGREAEFFWNFMIDQQKQTSCERNMLTQLDLLPSRNRCHVVNDQGWLKNVVDSSPMVEQKSSYEMQAKILKSVYQALPDLSAKSRACDLARAAVNQAKANELVASQTGLSSMGPPDSIIQARPQVVAAKQKMASECGKLESSISGLWSGDSAPMNSYIRKWIARFQAGRVQMTAFGANQFMSEALPVDRGMHYTNDSTPQQHRLIFEEDVINPMACQAQYRDEAFNSGKKPLMKNGVPAGGSNTEYDPKIFLLADGGKAALAYMARSKYRDHSEGLTCQIMRHYSEIPATHKKYKQIGEVVIGGVAVVVTSGAALEAEGVAVAGFLADSTEAAVAANTFTTATFIVNSATAAMAATKISSACDGMIAPQSLQLSPVCEMFQNVPKGTVPSSFSTQIEKRASCQSVMMETAMDLVGAGTSGMAAVKLGQDAKIAATVADEAANSAAQAASKINTAKKLKMMKTPAQNAVSTYQNAVDSPESGD